MVSADEILTAFVELGIGDSWRTLNRVADVYSPPGSQNMILSLPCGEQRGKIPQSRFGSPPMNIDTQDSMLLLALIYLSGLLWHLDKAAGDRSSPLWSLLWPLALWLNVRGKRAKRH